MGRTEEEMVVDQNGVKSCALGIWGWWLFVAWEAFDYKWKPWKHPVSDGFWAERPEQSLDWRGWEILAWRPWGDLGLLWQESEKSLSYFPPPVQCTHCRWNLRFTQPCSLWLLEMLFLSRFRPWRSLCQLVTQACPINSGSRHPRDFFF